MNLLLKYWQQAIKLYRKVREDPVKESRGLPGAGQKRSGRKKQREK
ncbi:hypothetical protein MmTuc01_0680 [Methanosarcina mazei Tuc01]|jgi:hypothetical protein|uniref:Uncharacterized protein n=1 Tax=Methanosarcina mazei Tuc01 TaxID=1236903 RepID=M1Q7E9_METMZ|nr:hypothetical protein [Methanosarcina mazei]AGF96093.1 hypothetical protein MmTuc01_0680 [Methanosarcina mazei Tuc01]